MLQRGRNCLVRRLASCVWQDVIAPETHLAQMVAPESFGTAPHLRASPACPCEACALDTAHVEMIRDVPKGRSSFAWRVHAQKGTGCMWPALVIAAPRLPSAEASSSPRRMRSDALPRGARLQPLARAAFTTGRGSGDAPLRIARASATLGARRWALRTRRMMGRHAFGAIRRAKLLTPNAPRAVLHALHDVTRFDE
jgi:hypothetical protein